MAFVLVGLLYTQKECRDCLLNHNFSYMFYALSVNQTQSRIPNNTVIGKTRLSMAMLHVLFLDIIKLK